MPEDRRGRGLVAGMSVRENITLPALGSYARLGLVNRSAEADERERGRHARWP